MNIPFDFPFLIPQKCYLYFRHRIEDILKESMIPGEIIYIDDGSKDNTFEVLKKENQKVYSLSRNYGKYAAIEYGIPYCQYDTILMLDADIKLSLNTLMITYEYRKTYPVMIGCRFYPLSDKDKKLYRKLLSICGHFVSKNIFKLPYLDTQCGYKMFSKEIYNQIKTPMLCKRYLWDMEFLLELQKLNINVKEVPMWDDSLKQSTFKSIPMLFGSFKEFMILLLKK